MEHEHTDPVSAGLRRRILITGAGGQLGRALQDAFADDDLVALSHEDWDVTSAPSDTVSQGALDLVLHTAAWTDVDGAEADPQAAAAVNVGGTANAAALGAPLVAFSTDYVFDGSKQAPYIESDGPNPISAYGRTKLHGEAAAGSNAWVVRTSWLFGPTGHNFVRTMLRLGAERDEVEVVGDQRGCPTYVGHLAPAVRELVDRGSEQGSGTSRQPVTARGPTLRRRSSRRRDSTAACAGSRRRSSDDPLRVLRARSCGASAPARRCSRSGGTVCVTASTGCDEWRAAK